MELLDRPLRFIAKLLPYAKSYKAKSYSCGTKPKTKKFFTSHAQVAGIA
jgi:hypothetical protein